MWSQLLGQAISGPLKGHMLDSVPITHTTWADWRRRHPATEVLSTQTGFARDYATDPYAGYDRIATLMFDVQHKDDRLPLKEWVLGLKLGSEARAYPFSVLAIRVDPQGRLRDNVGGQPVEIRFDRERQSAEAYDSAGRPLPGVMAFWFAWVAFNPGTTVLAAPAPTR